MRFAKRDDLRWLSHLDLMRALQRAFQRAGVAVSYSRGFHPAPLMSFGPALAVGIEGYGEFFDFESSQVLDTAACKLQLNDSLPPQLRILEVERLAKDSRSLAKTIALGEYRAWVNAPRRSLTPELFESFADLEFEDAAAQRQRIATLLAQPEIRITRHAHKGDKEIDLRPFIQDIEYLADSQELSMWLHLGSQGQARPSEILEALYGVSSDCFRVRRQGLHAARSAESAVMAQQVTP